MTDTHPPQKADDSIGDEKATTVELLPVSHTRPGRGMAMAALVLSVVASTMALVALGLTLQKPAPQQAEQIERQRVIDRAIDRFDKEIALLQAETGRDRPPVEADPALAARLAAIEGNLVAVTEGQARQRVQSERLDRLNEDFQPLSASLASIEQRLRQAEIRLNQRSNAHLTALVVTSSSLQSALRSGVGFRAELSALEKLAFDDAPLREAASRLHPYADRGLPTAAMLAVQLEQQAGAALAALRYDPDQGANWWQQVQQRLAGLVTLRRVAGEVEGDDPAARLARAQFHASQQDLATAITLVEALPVTVRQPLTGWLETAKARILAEKIAADLVAETSDRVLPPEAVSAPAQVPATEAAP